MQRPIVHPKTFLKYMTDDDLIDLILMDEMHRLCNAMTIDFQILKEGTTTNEA